MGYEEHSDRKNRFGFKYRDKRPPAVLVAELFLLIVLVLYFAKIITLITGLYNEDPSTGTLSSANFRYYMIDLVMFFLTMSALLGMSSHKPAGWSKVIRSSTILALLTVVNIVVTRHSSVSGYINIDPKIILPVIAIVLLLMFTESVRRYYIPPFEELPPIRAWIRWVVFIPMFKGGDYHIVYPEDGEAIIGGPDDQGYDGSNLSGYTLGHILDIARDTIKKKKHEDDDSGQE